MSEVPEGGLRHANGGRCKQSQQLLGGQSETFLFEMNNVEIERVDSLEGWVAVKSNIFEELEAFKLGFIVQWNVIECKFAVTCHNRTLQRQRRKAEEVPGDPQMSWAGLFSVCDLKLVHQQFECVADVLGTCFPDLSQFEDGNIWDLLFLNWRSGPDDAAERDFEAPCRKLEKYLSAAIDICGRKIVLDTLFKQDERDVEEYFENLQEFKRKGMQEEISRAKGLVRQVRRRRGHRGSHPLHSMQGPLCLHSSLLGTPSSPRHQPCNKYRLCGDDNMVSIYQ